MINATGRVNRPSKMSTPPISSKMPAAPDIVWGEALLSGPTGKFKYFVVPPCRIMSPDTMRSTLSSCEVYGRKAFSMEVSLFCYCLRRHSLTNFGTGWTIADGGVRGKPYVGYAMPSRQQVSAASKTAKFETPFLPAASSMMQLGRQPDSIEHVC